ncbi:MAG: hypothetical protein ACTSQJ_07670 [Promethearchaeota archaeon]
MKNTRQTSLVDKYGTDSKFARIISFIIVSIYNFIDCNNDFLATCFTDD